MFGFNVTVSITTNGLDWIGLDWSIHAFVQSYHSQIKSLFLFFVEVYYSLMSVSIIF